MPSPQISLHPHLKLSCCLTSLPRLLTSPLAHLPLSHSLLVFQHTLAGLFLLLCPLSGTLFPRYVHSSSFTSPQHPCSGDPFSAKPSWSSPAILNYSIPTPTPGTSHISLCFNFSSRPFLSPEIHTFYQCVFFVYLPPIQYMLFEGRDICCFAPLMTQGKENDWYLVDA